MSNGKGSSPRNCHSKQFRDNYQAINWNPVKTPTNDEEMGMKWWNQMTIPEREQALKQANTASVAIAWQRWKARNKRV